MWSIKFNELGVWCASKCMIKMITIPRTGIKTEHPTSLCIYTLLLKAKYNKKRILKDTKRSANWTMGNLTFYQRFNDCRKRQFATSNEHCSLVWYTGGWLEKIANDTVLLTKCLNPERPPSQEPQAWFWCSISKPVTLFWIAHGYISQWLFGPKTVKFFKSWSRIWKKQTAMENTYTQTTGQPSKHIKKVCTAPCCQCL